MDSERTSLPWYFICLLIIPPMVYLTLISIYAYNFPFLDDYETVLAHALLTTTEQVKNWFVPHNEHLHVILKATTSFDLWIFGKINLVRHMWLGAFFFLVFFSVLMGIQRREGLPWPWLIPLPFLLFQPSYWGTITWSTTSLHNFPGLLFALLAFHLWKSELTRNKIFALVFSGLALLTNGFGQAVLGTLILWELINFWQRDKEAKATSKLPLVGLGIVLVTWIVFRVSLGELNLKANIDGNSSTEYIHFLLNFLGSCFHFLGSPWLIMISIVELASIYWLIRQGLLKKHPFLFYFIVYLLLSATMTAVGRIDLGPIQGLASRYRIYSTLLLCSIYLGLVHLYWKKWKRHRWKLPLCISVSLVFFVTSLLVNINNLGKIKDRLQADELRWKNSEDIHEFPHPEYAARILNEAEKAGIYHRRKTQN